MAQDSVPTSQGSVHKHFAENLYRHCIERGTIADFCRSAGINRQQFNKYLTGKTIPNPITLRKICTVLGIDEQELFGVSSLKASIPRENTQLLNPLDSLLSCSPLLENHFDFQVTELQSGLYNCYFPLPEIPGMVVRSLISVARKNNRTEFIRLTLFPATKGSAFPLANGKHKGLVCANQNEIYFFGVNKRAPYQLSLMTIEKSSGTNPGFYTGMMLSRRGNKPLSTRLSLVQADSGLSLKSNLKSLGLIHETDISLTKLRFAGMFA